MGDEEKTSETTVEESSNTSAGPETPPDAE